jgi:hypothetical protein
MSDHFPTNLTVTSGVIFSTRPGIYNQLHQFMPTKSVDDQVTRDETLFSNFVAEHNSCN